MTTAVYVFLSLLFCLTLETEFTNLSCVPPRLYPVSSFVISTHEIVDVQRPQEPYSFNPSIIQRLNGKLLFTYRVDILSHNARNYLNKVGYNILDAVTLHSVVKSSDARWSHGKGPTLALFDNVGDGRLFHFMGNLYMIYCCGNISTLQQVSVVRMNIDASNNLLAMTTGRIYLSYTDGRQAIEKNWGPFSYQRSKDHPLRTLYFVHSIVPHRILHHANPAGVNVSHSLLPDHDTVTNMHTAYCTILPEPQVPPFWKEWQSLHGGCPAKLVNTGKTWKYLSFFHTRRRFPPPLSTEFSFTSYAFGAYIFEAHPPFSITHISSEPIVADTFYSGKRSYIYGIEYVIFPGSFFIENGTVVLSYGRNDMEAWIMRMDLHGLLSSLVSVQSQRC